MRFLKRIACQDRSFAFRRVKDGKEYALIVPHGTKAMLWTQIMLGLQFLYTIDHSGINRYYRRTAAKSSMKTEGNSSCILMSIPFSAYNWPGRLRAIETSPSPVNIKATPTSSRCHCIVRIPSCENIIRGLPSRLRSATSWTASFIAADAISEQGASMRAPLRVARILSTSAVVLGATVGTLELSDDLIKYFFLGICWRRVSFGNLNSRKYGWLRASNTASLIHHPLQVQVFL